MWIFSKTGFASVVEHRDDSSLVLVRARVRSDLRRIVDAYFGGGEVIATPEADYPFRIIASKAELREAFARMADAVDYPNFKAAVTQQADEPQRCEIYEGVWSSLRRLETLNAAKRTHSS